MNYLWNSRILSGVNQTGGGVGAYGDRTTCYIDPEGKGRAVLFKNCYRYFYVRDEETGAIWNPGWYPANQELDAYQCTHGLGYSIICGEFNGVRASLRGFVNQDEPVEIWTITFKVFPFVEFTLTGYKIYCNYYSNLFTEFSEEHNLVIAYNTAQDRTHDRYNGFVASSEKITGFDTSKDRFIGTYGDIRSPKAVVNGKCFNSLASNEDMVGVLENSFALEPGEEKTYHVLMGSTNTKEEAVRITEKMFKPGKIEHDFTLL